MNIGSENVFPFFVLLRCLSQHENIFRFLFYYDADLNTRKHYSFVYFITMFISTHENIFHFLFYYDAYLNTRKHFPFFLFSYDAYFINEPSRNIYPKRKLSRSTVLQNMASNHRHQPEAEPGLVPFEHIENNSEL